MLTSLVPYSSPSFVATIVPAPGAQCSPPVIPASESRVLSSTSPQFRAQCSPQDIYRVQCSSPGSSSHFPPLSLSSLDSFCRRVLENLDSFPTIKVVDGLIFIGSRLVVPWVGTIQEDLFRVAHDTLGHFGAEKSYANLRSAYYWPRMRTELEDTGGEVSWKPVVTSWVHCRLWIIFPSM